MKQIYFELYPDGTNTWDWRIETVAPHADSSSVGLCHPHVSPMELAACQLIGVVLVITAEDVAQFGSLVWANGRHRQV